MKQQRPLYLWQIERGEISLEILKKVRNTSTTFYEEVNFRTNDISSYMDGRKMFIGNFSEKVKVKGIMGLVINYLESSLSHC